MDLHSLVHSECSTHLSLCMFVGWSHYSYFFTKRRKDKEKREEGGDEREKERREYRQGQNGEIMYYRGSVEEKRNFSTPPTKQLLNCAINKNLGMNSIFSDQTTHSGYSPLVSILSYHCCSNDRFSCSVFLRGKCQYCGWPDCVES